MKKVARVFLVLCLLSISYYYLPTKPTAKQLDRLEDALKSGEFNGSQNAVLIDYSKSVIRKRLWLFDLKTRKVILNCHVSHARNSGQLWASVFSNEIGSEFSCIGKFKTLNTYESNYGKGIYKVGLRLKGMELGNSNTLVRNIVFHTSFPLWSKGCFMTSGKNNKFIIDKLKTGSLVLVIR